MNMHAHIREIAPGSMKPSLFKRIVAVLAAMLSGPKGDQGGWEGGARGL